MEKPGVKSYSSREILELMGPAETQYATCNTQQVAGGDTPDTRQVQMGQTSGTFQFFWETYSQRDQIIVSYNGTVLFDSGCVGASATQTLSYSGASSLITVQVVPNCAGGSGTAWNYTVYCPTTPPTRR